MNWHCMIGGVAACLALSQPGQAQQVAAGSQGIGEHRMVASLLDRSLSIDVKDVTVTEAIRAAAIQADVLIQYKKETLDLYPQKVTIQMNNATLGTVLERIFAGTMLRVVPDGTGQLVVEQEVRLQGTLVGKVVHASSKQPVAGATVLVGAAKSGVTTEPDGTFRLSLSAGEHRLTVRAVGFVRQVRTVSVTDGETLTIEFSLEESASVLDEVVVTGTVVATERKAITTPITVIQGEELERRGITRIEQLFHGEVPGVFAVDRGVGAYSAGDVGSVAILGNMETSNVQVRGSSRLNREASPTPLKTFVDGVEILDASYLGTIDPQSIERIEIVTGPQAATIYGSGAMGGVMQIFTKKGEGQTRPEVVVGARVGLLQNSMSNGLTPAHDHNIRLTGGAGPAFSYVGTASHGYSGQWQPYLFSRRYAVSLGATHVSGSLTATGTLSQTFGRNGTTAGGGNVHSPLMKALSQSGVHELNPLRWLVSQRIAKSRSQLVSFELSYRPVVTWQHQFTAGRSQTTFDVIPQAPRFMGPHDTLYATASSTGQRSTLGYSATFSPAPLGMLSTVVTMGLNGSFADQGSMQGCLESSVTAAMLPCSYASLASFAPWEVAVSANRTLSDKSWGGFASWRIGVLERLYFTLGLRGERNPRYGQARKVDWTPTNGIAYTHTFGDVSLKLLGSYGSATRAPSAEMRLGENTVSTSYDPSFRPSRYPNPDLRPEYSRGPQGGIEAYFGHWGSLVVNRYKQRVTDLIESVMVDSIHAISVSSGRETWLKIYQYRNTATIESHGWEFSGSLNLWRFSVKGTYSWSDSRIASVAPNAAYGTYTAGAMFLAAPTHTGHIGFNYAHGNTNVQWTTNWIGKSNFYGSHFPLYRQGLLWRLEMYYDNKKVDGFHQWTKDAYAKSDLTVIRNVTPGMALTLNVLNIGNSFSSDDDPNVSPSLGRQSQIGVRVRFP